MSAPSNMAVAAAIIERLEPQVLEAWHHLDAWSSLEAAGVPVDDIRAVMDDEHRDTEPSLVVDAWQRYGARGLLVLCGVKEVGKTFAAVKWARDRHREGESTLWIRASSFGGLSLDDLRKVMAKAARADALVFDDAGAGTMGHGTYFASMLEGLLLERAQKPTIVSGNMNEAEMAAWLGPRVTNRQKQAGGLKHFDGGAKLRRRCHDAGRGRRWAQATALIESIGCERTRSWVWNEEFTAHLKLTGDAWRPWDPEKPEGHYDDVFRVGDTLLSWASRGSGKNRAAADAFGLDRDEIRARAEEIDAETDAGDLGVDQAAKRRQVAMALAIAEAATQDNLRRSETCYKALDAIKTRDSKGTAAPGVWPVSDKPGPRWEPAKLRVAGFSVVPMGTTSDGKGGRKWRAEFRGSVIGVELATEVDGWDLCAAMAIP